MTHLIRDIANPSDADPLYPPMRHKDWFVGHSWAGGLFPSASGRNQESTSEAVNAWYAIALFGDAIGDGRLALLERERNVSVADVKAHLTMSDSSPGGFGQAVSKRADLPDFSAQPLPEANKLGLSSI